ncbi:MAG: prepilin peptidase [Oscillospiraceae bacterium]|nr:prepilin peptidase [Oscillospiraceae bacterium]
MYSVITVILWEVFSLLVTFLMVKETNTRIAAAAQQQEPETTAVPYCWNTENRILLGLVVLLTGLCAYFVSQSVVSVWFCIEMGLCYITLLGAAAVDRKLKKIPNVLPFFLMIGGIAVLILQSFSSEIEQPAAYILSSLLGCFLAFVILMIAGKFSRGGIGMGDVKILCAVGLAGLMVVFSTLMIALFYCLIVMIFYKLMIRFGKISQEQFAGNLAFAPFLYLGFVTMSILKIY